MKKNKITCRKCNHTWITKSKLQTLICSSCGTKNNNNPIKYQVMKGGGN